MAINKQASVFFQVPPQIRHPAAVTACLPPCPPPTPRDTPEDSLSGRLQIPGWRGRYFCRKKHGWGGGGRVGSIR